MICVVSADSQIRESLVRALFDSLGAVAHAANARDALAVTGVSAFVIDLLSPGLSGEAFQGCGAPTIVIKAHGGSPVLLGVDRHLKPFTLELLIEAGAETQAFVLRHSQNGSQMSANAA